MSVGPMIGSVLVSAAGAPLAQTTGSDVIRARQDALVQQRGLEATQQTDDASGIGQTDGEDNQTNERDADGRSPWRLDRRRPALSTEEVAAESGDEAPPVAAAKDDSDEPGGHLDLSG